ncbi:MAG: leucine-rich repeat domain-containing protein [Paludibacteraceae bacterium]|nr:leucine-rich repeat domain-containing protein [Paludibacteraceae bacterium]
MKRYSLITLFFLTLTHTASAAVTFTDPRYSNLEFTVLDTEAKTVSVKGVNNASAGPIIIPATVNDGEYDYTVTTIAEKGFYNFTKVTAFTLPEGLTTIQAKAFCYCTSLQDVVIIPSTVTSIGDLVFSAWKTPIQFMSGTPAVLGNNVFRDDNKQNAPILIPCGAYNVYAAEKGWTDISQSGTNNRLEEICLWNIPTTFSDEQFTYEITSKYPAEVTITGLSNLSLIDLTIGSYVTYYDHNFSIVSIADNAFKQNTTIQTVRIESENLTTIGASAFYQCSNLTSFAFHDGLQVIKNRAFTGCTKIENLLIIPATVQTIDEYAFAEVQCAIEFVSESPATLGKEVFRDKNQKNSVIIVPCGFRDTYVNATGWSDFQSRIQSKCFDNFTIGNLSYSRLDGDVATLVGYADGVLNTDQEILNIPESVNYEGNILYITAIADSAFRQNNYIKKVSIPNTIVSIGNSAFYYCENIESITIQRGNLKSIGNRAFTKCTAITDTLVLPASLDTIGDFAFAEWGSPIRFTSSTPAKLGTDVFRDQQFKYSQIIIPCNTYETYAAKPSWAIYSNLFSGTNRLEEVCFIDIPETFQDETFQYRRTSKYPAEVSVLGFATTATDIHVVRPPQSISYSEKDYVVSAIAREAFSNNSIIDTLILPNTIKTIEANAFYYCTNLQCIKFNEGLETIKEKVFVNCYSMKDTVDIPASVQYIGNFAFADWTSPINFKSPTPPTLSLDGYSIYGHFRKATTYTDTISIFVPCIEGTLAQYKAATGWSNYASHIKSSCPSIRLTKDEALTQETIVSSIAFSRTFPMNLWQELYLPFEVDEVLVYDSDDKAYYDINIPFNSETRAGYFYLYGLKNVDMETGSITFQEVHKLEEFTPYLILFIDKNNPYFKDKEIVFKSKQGEYTLTNNYIAPTLENKYQLFGNETLWNQSVQNGFTLSSTFSKKNGIYNYDFHFNYAETAELPPFSWVVTPTMAIQSMPSLAPRFLSGRWGNQPSSGGGDTPTSMQTVSDWGVTYTQTGSQLTLYTQGQPCKVYSIDGTLLLSTNGSQEEVSIELDKGMYIIYSNGHSQKVLF